MDLAATAPIELKSNPEEVATASGESSNATSKLAGFKKKAWIFNGLIIAFVVGLSIAQVLTIHFFSENTKKLATQRALDILNAEFDAQIETLLTISESEIPEELLLDLLKNGNNNELVQDILLSQSKTFQLEFNTIVDKDGKIVVSAHDTRINQGFDPNGIISRIIASYSTGNFNDSIHNLVETAIITKQEYLNANAPSFVTTTADAYGSQYTILNSKSGSGMVTFACTAVLSSSQELLGITIVGYVLSGKHRILKNAMTSMGTSSFAIVHHLYKDEWHVSAMIMSAGVAEVFTVFKYGEEDHLPEIYEEQETKIQTYTTKDSDRFTIAMVSMPKSRTLMNKPEASYVEGDKTPGAFVIGRAIYKIDAAEKLTGVAIAAFLFATVLAIVGFAYKINQHFIDPLEKLIKAARKREIDKAQRIVESFTDIKSSIFLLGSGLLLISGLIAGMLAYNFVRVQTYYDQGALWSEIQTLQLFYKRSPADHFVNAKKFSLNPIFQEYSATQNVSLKESVEKIMEEWLQEENSNIFMMLNSSLKVIASGTTMPTSSVTFDPKGLVSASFESGNAIRASVLLSYSEYSQLNPRVWTNSRYAVETTQASAAMQILAFPVSASATDPTTKGVLVMGRTLNGNAKDITLKSVEYAGTGCAAILYIQDGETVQVSSAYRNDEEEAVHQDVDIPAVPSLVEQSFAQQEFLNDFSLKVFTETFEVSSERAYPGSEFDSDDQEHLSRRFDDNIYLVQCNSLERWNGLLTTLIVISAVTFFGNLLASSILAYVTFKPMYMFARNYESKWPTSRPKISKISMMKSVVSTRFSSRKSAESNMRPESVGTTNGE